MAITQANVVLESGKWTNLYLVTGIAYGSQIAVQNVGSSDIKLSTSLVQPDSDTNAYQVIQPTDFPMTNDAGDVGAWAFSANQDSKINVWEVN